MSGYRIAGVAITACFAAAAPQTASAQGMIPDIIGQVVASSMNRTAQPECLTLETENKPRHIERFDEGAEIGMANYLALAAQAADLGPAYRRNWDEPWSLDGDVVEDRDDIRDPWAARVDRLEPVGKELGRFLVHGRAIWQAYDADGVLLGTYDAEMVRRSGDYAIGRLKLYSPGKLSEAEPLTPYCANPGDHRDYVSDLATALEEDMPRYVERLADSEERLSRNPDGQQRIRRVARHRQLLEEQEAALAAAQAMIELDRTRQAESRAAFARLDGETGG